MEDLKNNLIKNIYEENSVEKSNVNKPFYIPAKITDYVDFEYKLIKLSCIFNDYFEWNKKRQQLRTINNRKIDILIIEYKMKPENELQTKSFYFDITDCFYKSK